MLGQKIKLIRNKSNLTVREFAEKINIPKSTLSHYENNNRAIPFLVIVDIIKAFNLDINIFIDDLAFERYKNNLPSINQELYQAYNLIFKNLELCMHKISFSFQCIPLDFKYYTDELTKLHIEMNSLINIELIKEFEKGNSLEIFSLNSNIDLKNFLMFSIKAYDSINIIKNFCINSSKLSNELNINKSDLKILLNKIEDIIYKIKLLYNTLQFIQKKSIY